MPFDGKDYGTQGLIPPIYAHPGAHSVGDALGGALVASYSYLRTNARLIGHTTWPNVPRTYFRADIALSAMSPIAQHVVSMPFCATHVLARVQVRGAGGYINARVVVTDGSNTDTGQTVVLVAGAREQGQDAPIYFSEWHPDDPSLGTLDCYVQLVDARIVSGVADRTVTIEMNANDEGGDPLPFWPGLVSVWWSAIG